MEWKDKIFEYLLRAFPKPSVVLFPPSLVVGSALGVTQAITDLCVGRRGCRSCRG